MTEQLYLTIDILALLSSLFIVGIGVCLCRNGRERLVYLVGVAAGSLVIVATVLVAQGMV